MNYRHAAIALLVVGTTLAVVSSGGFSSVSADRHVHVSVAEPGHGLVGVEPTNPSGLEPSNNETVVLFEVRNNLGDEVDLTVKPAEEYHNESPLKLKKWDQHSEWSKSLPADEDGTISGTVVCNGNDTDQSETYAFEITVRDVNESVLVEMTREVTVTCDGG